MVLTDRFLTAMKTFLEAREAELAEVRLRDWGTMFSSMVIVLDVEDEPVEDEDVRGLYEISATINIRCEAGVADEDRRAMMELVRGVIDEPDETDPDQFDFVVWCRTAEDRGIGDEELGIFDLLIGGGSWEISDEEVTGVIEVQATVMPADLTAANFGG